MCHKEVLLPAFARHASSASSVLLLVGAQRAPVASDSLAVDVAVGNALRNILVALGPLFCQPPLCSILFSLLRLTRTSLPARAAACHISIPSYARSPPSIHNRHSWRCPVRCHCLWALPSPPLVCIVLCSLLRHIRNRLSAGAKQVGAACGPEISALTQFTQGDSPAKEAKSSTCRDP